MSSIKSNLSVLMPTTHAKNEVAKAEEKVKLAKGQLAQANEEAKLALEQFKLVKEQNEEGLITKAYFDNYQHALSYCNLLKRTLSLAFDQLQLAQQQLQKEADDDFDRKVAGTPCMRRLSALVGAISREHVHPWNKIEDAGKKKTKRDSALRERVIEYYDGQLGELMEKGYRGTCLVTKRTGDGSQVIVAHLLPHGSDREYWMNVFDINDIDDMHNVMLLSKNIEHAFDRLRLSFVITEDGSAFRMKIWDPAVRNVEIFEGSDDTIGDFEEKDFVFPNGKRPFTRVLSFQNREAYTKALKMGWIDPDEPPPDAFGSPLKDDVLDCHVSSTSFTEPPGKLVRRASTSSTFAFNTADSSASPE